MFDLEKGKKAVAASKLYVRFLQEGRKHIVILISIVLNTETAL